MYNKLKNSSSGETGVLFGGKYTRTAPATESCLSSSVQETQPMGEWLLRERGELGVREVLKVRSLGRFGSSSRITAFARFPATINTATAAFTPVTSAFTSVTSTFTSVTSTFTPVTSTFSPVTSTFSPVTVTSIATSASSSTVI